MGILFRNFLRRTLPGILFAIAASYTVAFADAPQVTHLFPAGIQRGATRSITCKGSFDWPLRIWSSFGEALAKEGEGEFTLAVPDEITTDRLWLRFYNDEGTTSPIPFLLGNLPETTETEPNDSPSTAQQLSSFAEPPNDARVVINGRLQKRHDVDAFAVELKKGQTLVAAIAANKYFGSPLDAILQVVTPDGIVLAENHDDAGLDPRLAFTCPHSGTYIVRVFGFPSQPNQSISFHGSEDCVYRLTLTTGPYLLHTSPSAVSADEFGALRPRAVQLLGWNLNTEIKAPVRKLLGGEVTSTGSGGLNKPRLGLVAIPGWANTRRIQLVPHPVLESKTTSKEAPHQIQLPSTTDNCIATPGNTAYFRIPLQKSQRIRLSIDALSIDSLLAPTAKLYDPTGKPVFTSRESGADSDIVIAHTATTDGDYVLEIRDRYSHGSRRHYFRLTAIEPKSDFQLAVTSDSVVVTTDKETELPITIQRDIHEEPIGDILIDLVGGPANLRCEPITSKASGETSKKVTLVLKFDGGASYSGPIRVRGREASGGLPRYARTPERFGATFETIWITTRTDGGQS